MGGRLGAALAVEHEGTEGCGGVWPSPDRGTWEGSRRRRMWGGRGKWWVAGSSHGACAHPLGMAPQKESLSEREGAEIMMGRSRPSSKSVQKKKFRSTGNVLKGKGTGSTTYKCKIAARKVITSSLFHREWDKR